MRGQKSMILLKRLRCRIVQADHMARPDRDEIVARRSLGVQRTSLSLWRRGAGAASGCQTENVVAVARDDINRCGRCRRLFQSAADGEQFSEADDIFLGEIALEDALVVGTRFAPEVAAAAGHGGCDEVGGVVAGETGGVEFCGYEDGLG